MVFDPFLNSKEEGFDLFLKKKNFSEAQKNFKKHHFPSLNDNQGKLLAFLSSCMTINQNSINTIYKVNKS